MASPNFTGTPTIAGKTIATTKFKVLWDGQTVGNGITLTLVDSFANYNKLVFSIFNPNVSNTSATFTDLYYPDNIGAGTKEINAYGMEIQFNLSDNTIRIDTNLNQYRISKILGIKKG